MFKVTSENNRIIIELDENVSKDNAPDIDLAIMRISGVLGYLFNKDANMLLINLMSEIKKLKL